MSWPCQYENPLHNLYALSEKVVSNGGNSLQNINTTRNQRIRSAILIFVPAVRSPNLELGNSFLNVLNLRQELGPCEVTAV
jgi:hypothetical protein